MKVVLHPDKDFLNPRNPSSPFAFVQSAERSTWKYINEHAILEENYWCIKINDGLSDHYYFEPTRQDLFNAIKHHFTGVRS